MPVYIGVDVGEQSLDVWDPQGGGVRRVRNTAAGVARLVAWVRRRHPTGDAQLILEPTSVYHHRLIVALGAQGIPYTVINPRRTASFAQGEGRRAKTDMADARLLAQMGEEKQLPPSPTPEAAREQLKYLRRQSVWLEEEAQRARNRKESLAHSPFVPPPVLESLERTIRELEAQRQAVDGATEDFLREHPELAAEVALVDSIKGIGWRTAVLLVSEMPPVRVCGDAKDWVAYAGVAPEVRQSGKRESAVLSRMGPAAVRKGLHMAALAALRSNPPVQALGQRLEERGKQPLQIVVAAMVKLVRQSFAVLRSGVPFDPHWHTHRLDTQHGI